jgi:hypothetical protein
VDDIVAELKKRKRKRKKERKKEIAIILQYCHSTKRNVSRDITASSITSSLGVS